MTRPFIVALVTTLLYPTGAVAQGPPLGTPIPEPPLGSAVETTGPEGFLARQLAFSRVTEARDSTDEELKALFAMKGLGYPPAEIYLRVFKHERVMELWARADRDSSYTLVKEYAVCALPGQLGPKRRMGDFQVPEGFYYIDDFNPRSNYHLSLRVSYPNLADRMRREAIDLGGDIFVHGGCETVGCVPIENANIREVYWLAAQALEGGQRVLPIHIFPSRMDERSLRWLEQTFQPGAELRRFWDNLAEGYAYFEANRRVPWITVAEDGSYQVPAPPRLADEAARADSTAAGDSAATSGGSDAGGP
ncbi:MAG: murein L,D-transpeptidase family protein [Gemmatimonadota bacterium]